MSPPSPLRARVAAAALLVAIGIAATWPATLHLGREVPGARLEGDVALNLWALAWLYHQAPREPSRLLDSNIFHPASRTLALSDLLFGEALLGLPGQWLAGPVAAYGAAFVLAAVLTAAGAFLAARRLDADPAAAAWAAVAAATLPYLAGHTGHLQLQMLAPFPLVVVALPALADAPGPRRAILAGAVIAAGAWFSAYYAVLLALEAALVGAVLLLARRQLRSRRGLTALAAAALTATVLAAPPLLPHVGGTGQARSVAQAHRHAARLGDYSRLTRTAAAADSEERQVALPITTLALAAVGIAAAARRREQRDVAIALAALAVVGVALSLGPAGPAGGIYSAAMRLPGLSGLRAAARFGVLPAIAAVLLASIGLAALRRRLAGRGARAALTLAALAGVLLEVDRPTVPTVPVPPPGPLEAFLAEGRDGAILHLPSVTAPDERDSLYMLASRAHFRPLVNGYSGGRPEGHGLLLRTLADLPSPGAMAIAADLGVRDVVVHRGAGREGAGLEAAARAGDPAVVVAWRGADATIYELRPERAAGADPLTPPPPPPLGPLPFAPGESLSYQVRWSRLDAGSVELTVLDGAHEDSIIVTGAAATAPGLRRLYEATFEARSELEASQLLPLRVERDSREGARRRQREARYDASLGAVELDGLSLPLRPGSRDPLGALYALRALPLAAVGDSARLPVDDLGNPIDLTVTVVDASDEQLQLLVTSRELRPTARQLRLHLTLEASGARRPLLIRADLAFGQVRLELVTRSPPRGP